MKVEKGSDPAVIMGFSVRTAIKNRDSWESLDIASLTYWLP